MNDAAPRVTVLYDGACPLCRREIGVYQRSAGAGAIRWQDVSVPGTEPGCITREDALRRFHVIDGEGRIRSGADAFITLWLSLPRWRWIGRLASLPPLPWLLERAYRGFLRVRPSIQRLAARRPG